MSRDGHLAQIEREAAEWVSRHRFQAEMERARCAGFSEREAPFVASARTTRGPTTVAEMRAHLEASHPELYEEAS